MFDNKANFKLKVIGEPRNLIKFINILQNESKENNIQYILNIHNVRLSDYTNIADGHAKLDGDCYTLVRNTMINSKGSSYEKLIDEQHSVKHLNHATHLEALTKKLDLIIEIYSDNIYDEIEEHYIINKGIIEEEEHLEMREFFTIEHDNVQSLNLENDVLISKSDFLTKEFVKVGGFGNTKFKI